MTEGAWPDATRERRSALIIASNEYADPGLSELRAPAADADALAEALSDPEIGGFEVRTLLNQPAHEVNEAVEEFFVDRSPDHLLLLHFSCHGIKDRDGDLYFAMANTKLRLLGATAVAANFVNRRMTQSRSRRIVLFLDCCYAGAFDRGMTARASKVMDLEERFSGRGRAVITASGAVEYAFEAGELTQSGDPAPSVFTSAMVQGLTTGEADRDQDGYVDLDELYDYVYDAVREVTPHQTPGKWTFGVQGDLVIARRRTPVTEPSVLPAELQASLDSPLAGIRARVVDELVRLLTGRHQGLSLAARQALQTLADDDSRSVVAAASAALATADGSAEEPTGHADVPPSVGGVASAAGQAGGSRPARPRAPGKFSGSAGDRAAARAGSDGPGLTEPAGRDASGWWSGGSDVIRRWWPATTRGRLLVALAVVVLLAGGGWWFLDRTGHSTTVPDSFDGEWVGEGIPTGYTDPVTFTATLVRGHHLANLNSGASSCFGGALTVTDATNDRLTTRFVSDNPKCNQWTVVFTHLSGDDLKMAVDPDSNENYEHEFEATMSPTD